MKVDKDDLKSGIVRITTESADDLWTLYTIIQPNDVIKMRTMRKVKVGSSERAQNVEKRPMTLFLKAERAELEQGNLKVLGTVLEGPDDVPKGSHHSFHIDEHSELSIKKFWKDYQLKKLEQAEQASNLKVLLVVCDREQAFLAQMKAQGYHILGKLAADITKKRSGTSGKDETVFALLKKKVEELVKDGFAYVIIGSPSFWHAQIKRDIVEQIQGARIHVATVAEVDAAGIDELLKRPETKTVLSEQRALQEIDLVEQFLTRMAQEKPYTYGLNDCMQAAEQGAVEVLLVSEGLLLKLREQGGFGKLEKLMHVVESARGEVHLISPEHEGGKKLDGLSGVAAMLRYAV